MNECDQEVDKTPVKDYGQDVIFKKESCQLLDHIQLNSSYHYHHWKQKYHQRTHCHPSGHVTLQSILQIFSFTFASGDDITEKIWTIISVYHEQKDGSEFSDVTLASEDDNDNSDVIVFKKLDKFSKG